MATPKNAATATEPKVKGRLQREEEPLAGSFKCTSARPG